MLKIDARAPKESAKDYVVRQLIYNIIHVNLIPGQRIDADELSRQLNVSKNPVREAELELSQTRLIEIKPKIGAFVSYIDTKIVDEVRELNGAEPASRFYIRFQSERGLKKAIADIKARYSLTTENVVENTAVLSLLGASSNESVNALYPLAISCFVIILIAGVFMISGCMNSNVAQRTKFFGMLRCIGASKRQIIRFVRLEALNWCRTAIPIGCTLGTVICWISCLILRFFVKGEWADMPLFSVSISGILCGAAIGVITVFIAAQAPAEQAASGIRQYRCRSKFRPRGKHKAFQN